MGLLDRKKLLEKEKIEIEKVELADGDFVFVCQMTGRGRDQFERSLFEVVDQQGGGVEVKHKRADFRAKLAVNTICDEKGILLLRASDWDSLSQNITAKSLEKIINVAQKLNAITEEDKEELVKNSEGVQDDASSSDSASS